MGKGGTIYKLSVLKGIILTLWFTALSILENSGMSLHNMMGVKVGLYSKPVWVDAQEEFSIF